MDRQTKDMFLFSDDEIYTEAKRRIKDKFHKVKEKEYA